jgi:hypothetical protein
MRWVFFLLPIPFCVGIGSILPASGAEALNTIKGPDLPFGLEPTRSELPG